MKIFISALCILFFEPASGQKDISINMSQLRKIGDSVLFTLTVENSSPSSIAIFKPNILYVNYGLIGINLIGRADSNVSRYNYGARGDIDKIILGDADYVVLMTNECFSREMLLHVKNFLPNFKSGRYKVEIILDYSIVDFEFPCSIQSMIFKKRVSAVSMNKLAL